MGFQTWGDVQRFVDDESEGAQMRTFVKIIDDHGADVVIDVIDGLAKEKDADVVVATAHKTKGLEFDTVRIAHDFQPPKREPGQPLEVPTTDAMLAYVAETRAKTVLDRGGLAWIDDVAAQATPVPVPTPEEPTARPTAVLMAVPEPAPVPAEQNEPAAEPEPKPAPETLREIGDRILAEGAAPETDYMAQRLRSAFPDVDPALIGDIVITAVSYASGSAPDRRLPNLVQVGRELKAAVTSAA
ncbi:3'-5' exonuclease [Actinomadura yumaensis]